MHLNGFDPNAAYRVCTYRGFEHGPRRYELGDRVTTAEINAVTLFTLYRFRFVEKVAPAPVTQPEPTAQPALTTMAARYAALGIRELKTLCKAKGLDDRGNEATLRDRLLAVVG